MFAQNFSPNETSHVSRNVLRSPLSPMRRHSLSRYKKVQSSTAFVNAPNSDNYEDSENSSPLQITKTKSGLMKVQKSPYVKRKRVQTREFSTQTTPIPTTPAATLVDNEQSTTLTMTHARQFRGLKMKAHTLQMKNDKLQEELSTYKGAAMDVARQSRSTRASLKKCQERTIEAEKDLENFKLYSISVVEKLKSRLERMTESSQKAQKDYFALKNENDMLQQVLVLEREEHELGNGDQLTFYALPIVMAMFVAILAAITLH
jgi:hypothetical protein